MAEDVVCDPYGLERLLGPIPGEAPAGPWLRYDPIYEEIREARRADDPTLPQGVWERELKRADWGRVRGLCETALAERSKDLQVAVWLTECWLRMDGYPGLVAGFDLIAGLCEEYWDGLHPTLDEEDGDAEMRMGPLAWANERLPVLIRMAPLTRPAMTDAIPRALIDWENQARIQALEVRDKAAAKLAARDKPSRAELEASVAQTPLETLGDRLAQVEAALAEIGRLDGFLDERCPKQAPSLSGLRDALDAARDRLESWIAERGGLPQPSDRADDDQGRGIGADADTAAESDADGAAHGAIQGGKRGDEDMAEDRDPVADRQGAIRSRKEAYRRLEEAADYLLRTEPHSPVPYMIKRAVAWGDMGFGELMLELMAEEGDKKRLLKLLGLDKVG